MAARSAGHAKSGQWREANDAGYEFGFTDFRVKRVAQFDDLAAQYAGRRGPITIGWEDKNDRESYGCLAPA